MFNDIVEIMTYVLEQVHLKKTKVNHCEEINDVYVQLGKLHKQMNLVITCLLTDIDHYSKALFCTPKNKWISILNAQLDTYEHLKHGMFFQIVKLEENFMSSDFILSLNFSNMLLNYEDHLMNNIAYADDDFKLHIYRVNFIKTDCPKYRRHKELLTDVVIDIDCDKKKLSVIENAKKDVEEIEKLLKKFEDLLQKTYGIEGLLSLRSKTILPVDDFLWS